MRQLRNFGMANPEGYRKALRLMKMAEKFGIAASTAALNGGEDYELLFTVSPDAFSKLGTTDLVTVIGHVTKPEEGKYFITNGNNKIELKAQGWNPIKN